MTDPQKQQTTDPGNSENRKPDKHQKGVGVGVTKYIIFKPQNIKVKEKKPTKKPEDKRRGVWGKIYYANTNQKNPRMAIFIKTEDFKEKQ